MRSNEVLLAKVIKVSSIVGIIDFKQKLVLLFKEEVSLNSFDKHRVKTIVDHFCLAYLHFHHVFTF